MPDTEIASDVFSSQEQSTSKALDFMIACMAFAAFGALVLYGLAFFCETASELAQYMTQKWTRAA